MPKLVSLNTITHKDLRLIEERVPAVGASERMIPVVLTEFLKLTIHYPIVLTKRVDSGQFTLVAITGFDEDDNLFWHNNKWDASYIPLNIARQPFFLGDGSKGEKILCIDIESDCISSERGEALFDQHGEPTAIIDEKQTMLAQLLESEAETAAFVERLLENDLLMPLTLELSLNDQSQRRVQGIYTIDEERLKNINGQKLIQLHCDGDLKHIYIMIASLGHIYGLVQRKNSLLST